MLRQVLLAASRSDRVRQVISDAPVSRGVVRRYVAGEGVDDALRVAGGLAGRGLLVSLDRLGEDTLDRGQAEEATKAYVDLLNRLREANLVPEGEVSVKLSALGQALDAGGERLARDNAARICAAAREAGSMVTLDMEHRTTVDSTLRVLGELRADFPDTAAVIQSYLRRSETDCRELARAGARVRLCKGAYASPEGEGYQSAAEVDRSYVRCLRVLMAGHGYPMVATHDPRLIEIAGSLGTLYGRNAASMEYQMLYGVRPGEQLRLTRQGQRVRVYVPYGTEWYSYLMRRLAERPANVAFFARSLLSRG